MGFCCINPHFRYKKEPWFYFEVCQTVTISWALSFPQPPLKNFLLNQQRKRFFSASCAFAANLGSCVLSGDSAVLSISQNVQLKGGTPGSCLWKVWCVFSFPSSCVFILCVFCRGRRATDLIDQIACWTFCLSDRLHRDHVDHLGCWVCVLSGPFPSVQTMLEVHPSTEMERRRCSHCVGQVRPSKVSSFFFSWTYICTLIITSVKVDVMSVFH